MFYFTNSYVYRRFLFLSGLVVCLIGSISDVTSLPFSYSSDLPVSTSFSYDILDSNGEVTFWGIGTATTEIGGTIQLRYADSYTEWDQLQPFFNITFFDKKEHENLTIANISNSNLAMTLILGFGSWQPGFFTPNNWTDLDQQASTVANTPPSDPWSMNGTVIISSDNGVHMYNYTQNASLGDQTTLLRYKEENGLLLEWESTFWGYYMHAKIKDSSSPFSSLSSFPFTFIMIFVGSSICMFLIITTNKQKKEVDHKK